MEQQGEGKNRNSCLEVFFRKADLKNFAWSRNLSRGVSFLMNFFNQLYQKKPTPAAHVISFDMLRLPLLFYISQLLVKENRFSAQNKSNNIPLRTAKRITLKLMDFWMYNSNASLLSYEKKFYDTFENSDVNLVV